MDNCLSTSFHSVFEVVYFFLHFPFLIRTNQDVDLNDILFCGQTVRVGARVGLFFLIMATLVKLV